MTAGSIAVPMIIPLKLSKGPKYVIDSSTRIELASGKKHLLNLFLWMDSSLYIITYQWTYLEGIIIVMQILKSIGYCINSHFKPRESTWH